MSGSRDDAVAGALGIVLMLAVLTTALSMSMHTRLPIYGEQAEHEWDQAMGSAFHALASAAGEGMSAGVATSTTLPGAPVPQTIDVPLLGDAAPLSPEAVVVYEPSCGGATASHKVLNGTTVPDLTSVATGCLRAQARTVYSPTFAYSYELGGVVRVQSGRAVVVAGPQLALDTSASTVYRVGLTVPGLRGSPLSSSLPPQGIRIDMVPGSIATEVEQQPNAVNATWTFNTSYPAAWKAWFSEEFERAGFVASRAALPGQSSADYVVACVPADCTLDAQGVGRVRVDIEGPRTGALDVRLDMTFGLLRMAVKG